MSDVINGLVGGTGNAASTGSAIGGAVSAAGNIAGSLTQKSADAQASGQALTGFNYLTNPANGFTGYTQAGSAANNQAADLLGVGGGGNAGGAAAGGGNPGVSAAMGTTQQGHISNLAAGATGAAVGSAFGPLGTAIGGLAGGLFNQFSKKNSSPLQDIHGALAAGKPVSDASWAKAGYGPGGSSLNGAPGGAGGAPGNGGSSGSAFSNYLNSTGYKFQMGQGQQAITGSAAARGLVGSGGTAKALTQFGQGLAGNYFNQYLGQLGEVAGRGVTAGQTIGQAGTTGGGNAGNFTNAGGVAMNNGISGAGGQIGGVVGGLAGNFFSGNNVPPPVAITPNQITGQYAG